jgi:hypothetical protein
MKNLLLFFLNFLTVASFAQASKDELIQITKEGLQQATEVTFISSDKTLQIGDLLFPCSTNTHVKLKHDDGNYRVEFFLQKNTTIKSTTDSSFKRAWFALPFKSKSTANEFIQLFEKTSLGY